MKFINRSLMGSILIGGLTIAPFNMASAAAPIEDLTQQGGNSYNDSPSRSVTTQGAGETPSFRPSTSPSPAPSSRSSMSTEQRINLLEQQIRNLTQLDPATQINRLQTEVDRLRGQVEVQEHTIKQLTEQLRSQYQDIDQRLSQTGKKSAAPLPTAAPAPLKAKQKTTSAIEATIEPTASTSTALSSTKAAKTQPDMQTGSADDNLVDPDAPLDINSADTSTVTTKTKDNTSLTAGTNPKDSQSEKKDYDAAIALLKKQDYVRATSQLQRYLRDYPRGQYTPSAHYFLGKIYSYQGQPDLAIAEYNTVVTKYPKDSKVPKALLELGIAYDEAGDWEQAKAQLSKVISLFPKTEVAQQAAARLQKIKRQGL